MRYRDYEALEAPIRARFASTIAPRRVGRTARPGDPRVALRAVFDGAAKIGRQCGPYESNARRAVSTGPVARLVLGGEAAPHGVLGDGPGQEELAEVVGAAGLGADPRELEPAERLAVDQGAGDRPVDVEVADPELALDPLDVRRAPRVEAAGQGVVGAVGDRAGRRRGRWPGGRPGPGRRSPPGRSGRRAGRRRRSCGPT